MVTAIEVYVYVYVKFKFNFSSHSLIYLDFNSIWYAINLIQA